MNSKKRERCGICGCHTFSARKICVVCLPKVAVREPITIGDRLRRNIEPPLADQPTAAAPGSPEKVEVLIQRVEADRQLWHPDDAKASLK